MFEARWVRAPRLVRVTGYGPLFDEGAYEADGHIRVDFGSDTPFLEEGVELDSVAARHIEENVRQLIELTAGVEKASGATAQLSVRFTIERLRTVVLAAGVLLIVALVVFLARGKLKNPLNLKDIPKELGVNVQSDATGYTLDHSMGGHSRYRIHAAKGVSYKDNHAVLHDVKIELFGEDGSRTDRIEGAEFE